MKNLWLQAEKVLIFPYFPCNLQSKCLLFSYNGSPAVFGRSKDRAAKKRLTANGRVQGAALGSQTAHSHAATHMRDYKLVYTHRGVSRKHFFNFVRKN